MTNFNNHLFHLVDSSPWPFVSSCSALFFVLGFVSYIHSVEYAFFLTAVGFFLLLLSMFLWWSDVISEATFQGWHTEVVQRGLSWGFLLFLVSEVMIFFAFFWAYFHSSLSPSVELGGVWPPININSLDAFDIPFANTLLLLMSSCTVTAAHQYLILNDEFSHSNELLKTIITGSIFLVVQIVEYIDAPFNATDGIYGTTFFFLTGLHGLHVLVGTLFLIVCFVSYNSLQFSKHHHLAFEFAAWYWHFVDVVWLFLFAFVYLWGAW